MVRPPEEGETRGVNVILRVLEEERERWKAAAARSGMTLSAWLRKLANDAAPKSKPKRKR